MTFQDRSSPDSPFADMYSSAFSALVLILLISFVFKSGLSLASISTDFRWRRSLISLYTSFRLKLGDRVYNETLVGKDGWFFYTDDFSIDDYQKIIEFRPNKLARLQKRLDRLNADLKAEGVILLVVIPPDKSTIYPQYMPGAIPVVGQKSRLDQFIEYMKLNGNTDILDLRSALLTASRSRDIYHKTDTHWNDVGAYYAYEQIMNALSSSYPSLTPHGMSDYKYTYAGNSVHDLSLLMGLSNYTEENWLLKPDFAIQLEQTRTVLPDGRYIGTVTNADTRLPKLLVFRDSFYEPLAHFIEPHFSRVKTIPFTYKKDVWSLDWIQREKPDIVIIEVAERVLDICLPMLLEN